MFLLLNTIFNWINLFPADICHKNKCNDKGYSFAELGMQSRFIDDDKIQSIEKMYAMGRRDNNKSYKRKYQRMHTVAECLKNSLIRNVSTDKYKSGCDYSNCKLCKFGCRFCKREYSEYLFCKNLKNYNSCTKN